MQSLNCARKQGKNVSKLLFVNIEISELEKVLKSIPSELRELAMRIIQDTLRIYINSGYEKEVLPKLDFADNDEKLHAELALAEHILKKIIEEENPKLTSSQWKKRDRKNEKRTTKKNRKK